MFYLHPFEIPALTVHSGLFWCKAHPETEKLEMVWSFEIAVS